MPFILCQPEVGLKKKSPGAGSEDLLQPHPADKGLPVPQASRVFRGPTVSSFMILTITIWLT